MRKFSGVRVLTGLVLSGIAVISLAATRVTDQTTLEDNASSGADLTIFQDYSQYPGTVGQVGKIVRFFDFEGCGSVATGTVNLLPKIKVKDNILIRNGYIKEMDLQRGSDACANVTNSIGLNTLVDLKAAATNTAGMLAIIPVGTASTSVQCTNDAYVTATFAANSTMTNGRFMVVLDCEMAP